MTRLADRLADYPNPDSTYSNNDRARRRELTLGNQEANGMSALRGVITLELHATLEAALAKLATIGMCNPAMDGPPSKQDIDKDTETPRSAIMMGSIPRCTPCWIRKNIPT
ncbi:DUF222 domain-containing protein [Mycobacterium lepromatosis]|uniref:DUF222 domain-containing protein n=1 Tax=Mycobacterium lepromatosis TaxID=480418 RepID=UPI002351F0BE|nr:DUF222 domain-containing protein [Mycobacterium lepromatosis]